MRRGKRNCRADGHRRAVASAVGHRRRALLINWFPSRRPRRPGRSTRSGTSCSLVSIPIFVLVAIGRRLLRQALPGAAGRGAAWTARRSTATPRSRSSGPRSRRSSSPASWSTPTSCCATSRRRPANAGAGAPRPRPGPPVRLAVPATTRGPDGKPFDSRPALPARGRVGDVRHRRRGRPARLLGPGLPDEDRRRPGHHDPLPRDAQQAGQLLGGLRGALRPRPRVHAHRRRTSSSREDFDNWVADFDRPAAGEAAAAGGGSTPRSSSPRATARRPPAAPATRSPTPGRTARSARISTRRSARTTRRSSASRSSTPTPRSPGLPEGHHARRLPQTLPPRSSTLW